MVKTFCRSVCIWGLCVLGFWAQAQGSFNYYFIPFRDKAGTPYSISQPELFLSKRAIERRLKLGIPITERDLPVNPLYVQKIAGTGAHIQYTTRWLNGVVAGCSDEQIAQIQLMDFVDWMKIEYIRPERISEMQGLQKRTLTRRMASAAQAQFSASLSKHDYGVAYAQNHQIATDFLHEQGWLGEGVLIAIFDTGFHNVDKIDFFYHLFEEERIVATYDFVMNEPYVFEDDSHGRMVLSCMAAYKPGEMIGSAPKASYILLRTEDVSSEYRIEEYNWLRAAEYADSAGVDIINTSLGYSTFDEANMNYTHKDLDGKTSRISQAANIANEVGILVICSAGNEGSSAWRYITMPADSRHVLAVGAVDQKGDLAYFSSRGNTADGRIKPDVVAMGYRTYVVKNGFVGQANGTSFSAPVVSGMVACLYQAFPELSPQQLHRAVLLSADRAEQPDSLYGYGLPNAQRAFELVEEQILQLDYSEPFFRIYPSAVPEGKAVFVRWHPDMLGKKLNIRLLNAEGQLVQQLSHLPGALFEKIQLPARAVAGSYLLHVDWPDSSQNYTQRINIVPQR